MVFPAHVCRDSVVKTVAVVGVLVLAYLGMHVCLAAASGKIGFFSCWNSLGHRRALWSAATWAQTGRLNGEEHSELRDWSNASKGLLQDAELPNWAG